ncbi:hypothetical protein COLO4_27435 [Corchorus olitorius]|uniref:Uncharacterized protein n=1 Tax=Corchorus olitorius TaxID=93759 RepID=A0A1R3HR66_9ROSI|nr:hypothetical protein COLO4_27435 [Corchorus olitorius]
MTTEEDVAEAFAKEALRLDTDKQEEDVEEIPNSGQSSPLSSSDESGESGKSQSHSKQDLHPYPTSHVQRSQGVHGKNGGGTSTTTLSPVSTPSLQQTTTNLASVHNFMQLTRDESFGSVKNEQDITVNSEKTIPTEHMFLSPTAMETTPSKELTNGNLKKSVGASNDYSLPTSNLPPKFRLDSSSSSSSRLQLPDQAQQGNWMSVCSSSSGKKVWSNLQLQPYAQMTSQETSLLGAKGVLSPFQFDVLPTNHNKRKKSWQDESSPTPTELPLLKWDSPLLQSNKDHHHTSAPIASSSRPKIIKNKVYDPSYADMGLPVDPHLRLFLARREKEEENQDRESKRENEDSEKQGEDHTKTKG